MLLTSDNVETIFLTCLYQDEDKDRSNAIIVEGITMNFGFHPEHIEENKELIYSLLKELPDEFQMDIGGGWTFLNACNDKDGNLWGEHRNIEQLLALGIAIEKAKYLLPRDLWKALPGGMPYIGIL